MFDGADHPTMLGGSLATRDPRPLLLPPEPFSSGRFAGRACLPWFDPIVHLGTGAVIGWDLVPGPFPVPSPLSPAHVAQAMSELLTAEGRSGFSTSFLVVPASALELDPSDPPGTELVLSLLRSRGFPGRRLCIELSAGDLVADFQRSSLDHPRPEHIDRLHLLRKMGVRIALGGFRPDRHPLARMTDIPLDLLRLDPSVTAGIRVDARTNALVRSVALLADDLRIELLADGIDDAAHDDVLRRLGCCIGTGRRFRGPMSIPVPETYSRPTVDGPRGFPVPAHEAARLSVLHASGVLDTPSEPLFDDLAVRAAALCSTPLGLVSLVDHDRQVNKAIAGMGAASIPRSSPRSLSMCAHAICSPGLFVVEDIVTDWRFDRRGVAEEHPGLRFYAGAPMLTSDGLALGTVCVADSVPRQLDDAQRRGLQLLAAHAAAHLELRARRHDPRS